MCRMIPVVGMLFVVVGAETAHDDPNQILEKAIRASLGKDGDPRKLRVMEMTYKGVLVGPMGEVKHSRTTLVAWPDRARNVFQAIEGDAKTQTVIVVDRGKGWRAAGGVIVSELSAAEVEEIAVDLHGHWVATLAPIQEQKLPVTAISGEEVNGKPTVGIRVNKRFRPDVFLYFDAKSYLLVRMVFQGKYAGVKTEKEFIYSDHKKFGNFIMPGRIVEYNNRKKIAEWVIDDYRFPDKLNRELLERP